MQSCMITIVNYGMGNLRSIKNALDYLLVPNRVASSPEDILTAKKLILPGVGSFAKAMQNIKSLGLFNPLDIAVNNLKIPILGICLGMQLLADEGDEDGPSHGLGFIQGKVSRFTLAEQFKLPHIGFNKVNFLPEKRTLFHGLGEFADFYFVHNYRIVCADHKNISSLTIYGETFASSVEKDNIFGVQFHPEKSQSNGLTLLKNFASL